jgi:8-oxo-dGTP diphosphatase
MRREYPSAPLPSVGAVVFNGDQVLLVRRGQEPSRGKWSIPGGVMELGETVREAARREVMEECGVEIEAGDVIEVRDAIVPDEAGRIRFHYVLVDVIARYASGELRVGSDVDDARWVSKEDIVGFDLTPGLLPLLQSCLERGNLDFPEHPG